MQCDSTLVFLALPLGEIHHPEHEDIVYHCHAYKGNDYDSLTKTTCVDKSAGTCGASSSVSIISFATTV